MRLPDDDAQRTGLTPHRKVIGLVPAAGQATRIAPLPCSKELFPIGFRTIDNGKDVRPKVACHYLLEDMRLAGVTQVYIVLRQGKWDIPDYLGDGSMLDMHLAYLMMRMPYGPPFTLDQAYPFLRDDLVAFGFPDIIFQPEDAFVQLLARLTDTRADLVLGLFPTERPETMDMVDMDSKGWVHAIDIKPAQTHLRYGWILAVWTPSFTRFMHEYLLSVSNAEKQDTRNFIAEPPELSVGHVVQAAIREGLATQTVLFPGHTFLDIGTPDGLAKAVSTMSSHESLRM